MVNYIKSILIHIIIGIKNLKQEHYFFWQLNRDHSILHECIFSNSTAIHKLSTYNPEFYFVQLLE